jgi:hypothetical protein
VTHKLELKTYRNNRPPTVTVCRGRTVTAGAQSRWRRRDGRVTDLKVLGPEPGPGRRLRLCVGTWTRCQILSRAHTDSETFTVGPDPGPGKSYHDQ